MNLKFEEFSDLQKYIESDTIEFTDSQVENIEKYFDLNKKVANIAEVYIEEDDVSFSLSLSKSEWGKALNRALKRYRQDGLTDKEIDTWKLLKKVEGSK